MLPAPRVPISDYSDEQAAVSQGRLLGLNDRHFPDGRGWEHGLRRTGENQKTQREQDDHDRGWCASFQATPAPSPPTHTVTAADLLDRGQENPVQLPRIVLDPRLAPRPAKRSGQRLGAHGILVRAHHGGKETLQLQWDQADRRRLRVAVEDSKILSCCRWRVRAASKGRPSLPPPLSRPLSYTLLFMFDSISMSASRAGCVLAETRTQSE